MSQKYQSNCYLVTCAARTGTLILAHRPHLVAVRAAAGAAALCCDAFLSRRPSGLDVDGLALAERRAGVAAMERSRSDFALAAAFSGGFGRREILYPPRHRLGRLARCA